MVAAAWQCEGTYSHGTAYRMAQGARSAVVTGKPPRTKLAPRGGRPEASRARTHLSPPTAGHARDQPPPLTASVNKRLPTVPRAQPAVAEGPGPGWTWAAFSSPATFPTTMLRPQEELSLKRPASLAKGADPRPKLGQSDAVLELVLGVVGTGVTQPAGPLLPLLPSLLQLPRGLRLAVAGAGYYGSQPEPPSPACRSPDGYRVRGHLMQER